MFYRVMKTLFPHVFKVDIFPLVTAKDFTLANLALAFVVCIS